LAPTYVFHGPEGVGRRHTARVLACAVNCLTAPGAGCGKCNACHKILTDQHPDVILVVAEVKDIKIEAIREIQRVMGLKLFEGRWRFFVLDGAEHLNEASAHC